MYHIQARKKRLLLICGGIQTDPVVCWQKWKGACDNMRMAALLMAMIALLGSPQGEGTVSETTWETVAVQVLEETPETAARTLLDWAGSGPGPFGGDGGGTGSLRSGICSGSGQGGQPAESR